MYLKLELRLGPKIEIEGLEREREREREREGIISTTRKEG